MFCERCKRLSPRPFLLDKRLVCPNCFAEVGDEDGATAGKAIAVSLSERYASLIRDAFRKHIPKKEDA